MLSTNIELLRDAVQSWTAPVWFNHGLTGLPATVKDSGSCGFIKHGTARFLITGFHVLQGFRAVKRSCPEAVFAVNIGDGNTVALPEPNVIAEAEDLDIATIDFPDLDQNQGRTTKQYFPLDEWPTPRAQIGEPATVVGFPGQARRAFETFGAFEPVPIGMLVTSVSDRQIVLADERDGVRFFRHDRLVEDGMGLGGFSGSPAFGCTSNSIHLLGVVSDGSDRLGVPGYPGHLILGSAEYLMADGTLDESRMGWR